MPNHDIVVIGASAGGVEALKQLVSLLPANLPAAVFIVLHVSPHGHSALPMILSRAGPLPALHPHDGEIIQKGTIYVAPPDTHLIIKNGYISLSRGPKENGHRPAVDPMFRSAARVYGRRVVGVVLSGVLDDGTAGLVAVKYRKGTCIAQDPEEALYPGMPLSAIENDHVDFILPIPQIVHRLVELASEPVLEDNSEASLSLGREVEIADMNQSVSSVPPGEPAVFACPECGGTLWEAQEGDLIRFRCRVGHAFTAQSLLAEQADALEDAFWAALRALEERAALARRLAERARQRNQLHTASTFDEQARSAEAQAEVIRRVLEQGILRGDIGVSPHVEGKIAEEN
jgi:two-component system, chemotaxis family, protein-glutamate methylesterase/glutaminase